MSALEQCEAYWELISASLDGALTPEEQAQLDQHLSECPDCRAMWEQLSGLEPELMELDTPPEGFVDRVMAEVGQTEQEIPFTNLPQNRKAGKESLKQVGKWWKSIGALAACCLFLLGGGWFVTHMWRAGSSSAPAQNETATYSAADTAGAEENTSDAVTLPDESEQKAVVVPELKLDGQTYVQRNVAAELPEGFDPAGELTAEQAGNTDLAGKSYYTSPEKPDIYYVEDSDADGQPYYQIWSVEN